MSSAASHFLGSTPSTLSTQSTTPPVFTLIRYDQADYEERQVPRVEDLFEGRGRRKVSWIDVDGLGDVEALQKLGEHFGLHPLALEDVLHQPQRPKIEEYADHFFIVAQIPAWGEGHRVVFKQASLFLGKDFLITIQEKVGADIFAPLRERLRTGRGFARSRGEDYLAYALLDSLVDEYFPILEALGETIERLEDELLARPARRSLVMLHGLKRTLSRIRRNVWPLRDLFNALIRDESGLVRHDTAIFLRDCYDHTVRLMDVIESYRDLLAGMMDIYLSSVEMRTNEIMRVLTVVSTVFIPLTFIVGVYGMNFEMMPGLKSPHGFAVCMGVMAALALGMLGIFKHKKWI